MDDEKLEDLIDIQYSTTQKQQIREYTNSVINVQPDNVNIITDKLYCTAFSVDGTESKRISLLLPEDPRTGSIIKIIQGKNNSVVLLGNGKNFTVNYIKTSDLSFNTITANNIFSSLGKEFDDNLNVNFTVVYNGNEWQNFCTDLVVDITSYNNDSTISTNKLYGMINETTPITITVTYKDSTGVVYEGKQITLVSNNSNDLINGTHSAAVVSTDTDGKAIFNISSPLEGNSTVTISYTDVLGVINQSEITFYLYEDASTISVDKNIIYTVNDSGTITIVIKDTEDNKYNNKTIECISDQADVFDPTTAVTNVNGTTTFNVTSSTAHDSIIEFKNTTDNYVGESKAEVSFVVYVPPVTLPLNGLVFRLEADTGLVLDGSNINSWTDSVSNLTLSHVGDSSKSVLTNDAPSGVPTLKFSGYTHYTRTQSFTQLPIGNTDRSVCFIGKLTTTAGDWTMLGFGTDACQQLYNFVAFTPNTNTSYSIILDKGCDGFLFDSDTIIDWVCLIVTYNSANNNHDLYINGNHSGTTKNIPINSGSNFIRIMHTPSGDSYFGSLFVYNKILSSEEIQLVNTYAGDKYGF